MLASLRNLIVPTIAGALGWSVSIAIAWMIAVVVNECWLDYQKIIRWRAAAGLSAMVGRTATDAASTSVLLSLAVWGSSSMLAYGGTRLIRSLIV